jgi:hypothetical protein
MDEILKEVLEAVSSINYYLSELEENGFFETDDGCGYDLSLALKVYGFENSKIEYLGLTIWNSEDDDREFIVNSDSYEPMEDFLKYKINSINKMIKKIKI